MNEVRAHGNQFARMPDGSILIAETTGKEGMNNFLLVHDGDCPQPWRIILEHWRAGDKHTHSTWDRLDHAAICLYQLAGWSRD